MVKSVKSDFTDDLSDSQAETSVESAFSRRLLELLDKNNLSQAALSARSGVAKSKISDYCTAKRLPSVEDSIAVADALDVTVPYLILGRKEALPSAHSVPVLDLRVSGRAGAYKTGELTVGEMTLDDELMRQIGRTSSEGLVVMLNSGDSNDPLIKDGAPILVDERDTRLREGPLFTFRLGDELRVKKLRSVGLGDIEISSVNPLYPAEVIGGEIRDHLEIIGRVLMTWTKL
jgi:phage repressor protein C with HTH and peptisase S24 domain